MTFEELRPLVEELSSEDRQRLRQYLEQLEVSTEPQKLQAGTMNVGELLLAIDDIRKDLSDEDLDEIIGLW